MPKASPKKKSAKRDREDFLVKYTGIVHSVVKKYMYTGCDAEDMAQEGFIGLLRARETFTKDGGASFATYARQGVDNEIRGFCRKQLRHVQSLLLAKEDDPAGGQRHVRTRMARLDEVVRNESDATETLIDTIPGTDISAEDITQFHESMAEATEGLAIAAIQIGDNAVVMAIVANQTAHQPKTMRELADELGVSFQWIQMRQTALLNRARELVVA